MENQITCPHCKNSISYASVIDSEGNEAGLKSTFVVCECGEKVPLLTIITQLSDVDDWFQDSKIDLLNSASF